MSIVLVDNTKSNTHPEDGTGPEPWGFAGHASVPSARPEGNAWAEAADSSNPDPLLRSQGPWGGLPKSSPAGCSENTPGSGTSQQRARTQGPGGLSSPPGSCSPRLWLQQVLLWAVGVNVKELGGKKGSDRGEAARSGRKGQTTLPPTQLPARLQPRCPSDEGQSGPPAAET